MNYSTATIISINLAESRRLVRLTVYYTALRIPLLITLSLYIDELLDVDFQEDIAKLTRLADFLRLGLSSNDAAVISLSAKALGRLSKLDGSRTMAYEMCATELRTWLEVLAEKDRYEMKRQAAVTVLAQLASSAPSLFYLNLNRCVHASHR